MRFGDLRASRIENRAGKIAICLKDIGTDKEAIRAGPRARQVTTLTGLRSRYVRGHQCLQGVNKRRTHRKRIVSASAQ
jgi:hypothetical protein